MTIVVEGLRKTSVTGRRRDKKSVEAVRGVSFDVRSGERLAFIGPNGAGKSTSIKILTGILHPSGGTAKVLGITPWEARRQLAARIGVLFGQRSMLWSELMPRQSYRMLGAIHGLDRTVERQRVEAFLDLFDATDLVDQPVRTLSLGQRMRCELAACLLHEPSSGFFSLPGLLLDDLLPQSWCRSWLGRGQSNPVVVCTYDCRRTRARSSSEYTKHCDVGHERRARFGTHAPRPPTPEPPSPTV